MPDTTDTDDASTAESRFEEGLRRLGEWAADQTALGARLAGKAVAIPTRVFMGGLLKRIPKVRGGVAEGLVVAGHNMRKASGDVICNVIYGDGVVVPRRATWHSEDKVFETDNGEEFSAQGVGFDPKRIHGKVPVVWAIRDAAEITEPLEAAIANAKRNGRFRPFQRAEGPDVAVDIDPDNYGAGQGVGTNGGQPVADGGMAVDRSVRSGQNEEGRSVDGQVISFREGYKLFGSKIDQEDMKRQETRGKLAALEDDPWGTAKTVLYVFAAFALGLFGPSLATQLAGGGSDVVGNVGVPMLLPDILTAFL